MIDDAKARAFPGQDELIERGLREHPAFRDLCEDYRTCARALERWRRLNGTGADSRRQEYEGLLAELARDLAGWLEIIADGSLRRPGTAKE